VNTKKLPLVIAHRGASAYLPEHTLAAKALAVGMGADYLEQDLVATRDDQLIVSHDIYLDRVTDVARRFPGRARDDGRYYARDLDLAEIRTLAITERVNAYGAAVFPRRFPTYTGYFRVNTLAEELQFIEGLNRATGREVGIYPEIKAPAWHRREGVDLTALTLEILDEFGYRSPDDKAFVQCFDWSETRRIREELGCRLPLIQLIADPAWQESETDYDYLLKDEGLLEMSKVVDGIGPWINQLVDVEAIDGCPVSTGVVARAHAVGLAVHPYTFRADALPKGFARFDELLAYFFEELEVAGIFTDFPDLAAEFIRREMPSQCSKM
jgi:glycerophosphoryl diester phosphodiesterase